MDEMLASVRAALDKIDGASMEELSAMDDPFVDSNEKSKALGLDARAD